MTGAGGGGRGGGGGGIILVGIMTDAGIDAELLSVVGIR
jgi:hypothetical protein